MKKGMANKKTEFEKTMHVSLVLLTQENMSVKCVPPQTPFFHSKTRTCTYFSYFFPEAVLTCTHNLCFEQK